MWKYWNWITRNIYTCDLTSRTFFFLIPVKFKQEQKNFIVLAFPAHLTSAGFVLLCACLLVFWEKNYAFQIENSSAISLRCICCLVCIPLLSAMCLDQRCVDAGVTDRSNTWLSLLHIACTGRKDRYRHKENVMQVGQDCQQSLFLQPCFVSFHSF